MSSYYERSSSTTDGPSDKNWKQAVREACLCSVAENGYETAMAGEILPEMRANPKGIAFGVTQFLKGAFAHAGINISELDAPSIHLITDHRGNAEAWRLEYTSRSWQFAAKRLMEKTRSEQRGGWVDF